ncbi:uncharacterized protein [Centruroides vittatus]|uniref:uncharacterized protein n=1 Tax=Centruroides vittatus TaxID=120091 RepID=UPI0035105626
MVMDRKRSLYFASLILLLVTYRGIHGEEDEEEEEEEKEEVVDYKSDVDTGKYVFHGQGVTLYCNVRNKNPDEVKKLYWDFNGERIYTKRRYINVEKNTIFSGEIDDQNKNPFAIHIKRASIKMAGKYKCSVTYLNEKSETSEFYLPVIMDACKDSDWKFILNRESCEETIEMKCVGVFPRPLPQCIFEGLQEKQSISLHIESLVNKTYKISIHAIYKKKDFENVTDLTLSCKFVLDGTNYEFGFERHMFGERGCPIDYPDAGEGYVNTTNIENSCWDQPANGSILIYNCNDEKTKNLVCINDTWQDESGYIVSDRPYCGDGGKMNGISSFTILIAILMLYYYY